MTTDLAAAQADLRFSHFGGAPGMLASSIAWFSAALVAAYGSPAKAIWLLSIGGMLIHPTGVIMSMALRQLGIHSAGKPAIAIHAAENLLSGNPAAENLLSGNPLESRERQKV